MAPVGPHQETHPESDPAGNPLPLAKREPLAAALKLNETSRETLKRCAVVLAALLLAYFVVMLLGG